MAKPVLRAKRQEQARNWFVAFLWLACLSAVGAFIAFGNLFAITEANMFDSSLTEDHFNVGAAFGAAAGTMVSWLPVIALFDYLRRGDS